MLQTSRCVPDAPLLELAQRVYAHAHARSAAMLQMTHPDCCAACAGVPCRQCGVGNHDVVCLITHTGMIDLTKGIIDPGENPLQTALREAQEEASITNLDFKFGDTPLTHDATTMYVAETDQEPEVQRNPHSGLFEHRSAEMIPLKDLVDDPRLLEYLRPAVEYAYELVYSKPPM